MSTLRDRLRELAPDFLLQWYRDLKKQQIRDDLKKQKNSGEILKKNDLVAQLRKLGVQEGDVLLVHSSLSKIGYVEDGAQTVVNALIEAVGLEGHILMPTSPNNGLQLDYVHNHDLFDVRYSPSKLGAITECFREHPGVKRSWSPTEPVSCWGKNAEAFVSGHRGKLTPYDKDSPFYKVAEAKGKILYIGVTLINAGTSLHLLEDAVENFMFPVYHHEIFRMKIRDEEGNIHEQELRVHNPEMSARRRCDELIPLFEAAGVMTHGTLGNAPVLVADAAGMLATMLVLYEEKGITMYTPELAG